MGSLFENILRFSENISKDALIAIPSIAVAILLPMVIFLVEREKYPFDNMVIFEKIIRFKFFIVAIVVDVVCLVLPGQLFSLFSLVLSIIVVIITITATIRTHKWICSFVDVSSLNSYHQKKKIEYLDALKNKAEIVQTWHLVFASNEIEELNQHGLI